MLKNKWNYLLNLWIGPYRKRDRAQLRVDIQPVLGVKTSKTFDLDSFEGQPLIDQLQQMAFSNEYLPFKAQMDGKKFHIFFPKNATLQQAAHIGWKTLWNGSVLAPSDSSLFELVLPLDGWWRLSTPSAKVDFYFDFSRCSSKSCFSIKTYLCTRGTHGTHAFPKAVLLALLIHGTLFYMIQNSNLNSRHLSLQSSQQGELEHSAIEIPVNLDQSQDPFQGSSLFSRLNPSPDSSVNSLSQTSIQTQKVTQGLKKLALAFKTQFNQPIPKGPNTQQDFQKHSAFSLKAFQPQLIGTKLTSQKAGSVSSSQSAPEQEKVESLFSKNHDHFRGCYEKALLKFENMAVTISFEGEIASHGKMPHIQFKVSGRTSADAQNALVNCLRSVLTGLQFDPKLSGVKIRNQFIFKS